MKNKIITTALLILLVSSMISGCGGSEGTADQGAPSSKDIPGSSAEKEESSGCDYEIDGSSLVVTLESNQSTGCSWAVSEEVNLKETDSVYIENDRNGEMVGTGGFERHTLASSSPGEASATFSYGQQWEGGSIYRILHVTMKVGDDLRISDVRFEEEEIPEKTE